MAGETKRAVTDLSSIGLGLLDPVPFTSDDVNGDYFLNAGSDVLLYVRNPTAGALTITVQDVKSGKGRQLTAAEKDYIIPLTSGFAILGPFDATSFNQKTGVERGGVLLSYSAAGLEILPLRVPRLPA